MMDYLQRKIDKDLHEWKESSSRKPVLLRGARQVGKSSAVRNLGKKFENFFEINFENKDFTGAKKIFEQHSDPFIILSKSIRCMQRQTYFPNR